jgi:hypothetical protein
MESTEKATADKIRGVVIALALAVALVWFWRRLLARGFGF